jgi:GNAT superfamily N-acetyltransferase
MTTFDIHLAETDADIRRCYPVMAVLRPHIASADAFLEKVRWQQAHANWRLIYVEEFGDPPNGAPVAVSGFRISQWLVTGKTLYVDDLVALESHRGKGFAEALMQWMENFAREQGYQMFELDSGTHRLGAHRFYHRLKMTISAFHFQKKL